MVEYKRIQSNICSFTRTKPIQSTPGIIIQSPSSVSIISKGGINKLYDIKAEGDIISRRIIKMRELVIIGIGGGMGVFDLNKREFRAIFKETLHRFKYIYGLATISDNVFAYIDDSYTLNYGQIYPKLTLDIKAGMSLPIKRGLIIDLVSIGGSTAKDHKLGIIHENQIFIVNGAIQNILQIIQISDIKVRVENESRKLSTVRSIFRVSNNEYMIEGNVQGGKPWDSKSTFLFFNSVGDRGNDGNTSDSYTEILSIQPPLTITTHEESNSIYKYGEIETFTQIMDIKEFPSSHGIYHLYILKLQNIQERRTLWEDAFTSKTIDTSQYIKKLILLVYTRYSLGFSETAKYIFPLNYLHHGLCVAKILTPRTIIAVLMENGNFHIIDMTASIAKITHLGNPTSFPTITILD